MSENGPVTAYEWRIPEQEQSGAGLNSKLKPPGNFTQLEFFDKEGKPYLIEYEGRGWLKDKAALITGADSGIGRSVAILMAREGADITVLYLPEEQEDAELTKEYIEKAGRRAHLIAMDLLEDGSAEKAVNSHMEAFGHLDILVNNSARQEVCNNHRDIDMEVVTKTITLNLIKYMEMAKYALKHMKRGASIINSCSVAGYMGNPVMVDYASSKGGVATFTRSLSQQLAPQGIRVNAVAPGIIWTPLQPATKSNTKPDMKDLGSQAAPQARAGMPVEVATAYVFLASPTGSYFTGEVLHGTGGLEVQG